jgi:hypothetical protein
MRGFSSWGQVGVSESFLRRGFIHLFLSGLPGHPLGAGEPGDEHRRLPTVLRIRLFMRREQIAFFEVNSDQDVGGS